MATATVSRKRDRQSKASVPTDSVNVALGVAQTDDNRAQGATTDAQTDAQGDNMQEALNAQGDAQGSAQGDAARPPTDAALAAAQIQTFRTIADRDREIDRMSMQNDVQNGLDLFNGFMAERRLLRSTEIEASWTRYINSFEREYEAARSRDAQTDRYLKCAGVHEWARHGDMRFGFEPTDAAPFGPMCEIVRSTDADTLIALGDAWLVWDKAQAVWGVKTGRGADLDRMIVEIGENGLTARRTRERIAQIDRAHTLATLAGLTGTAREEAQNTAKREQRADRAEKINRALKSLAKSLKSIAETTGRGVGSAELTRELTRVGLLDDAQGVKTSAQGSAQTSAQGDAQGSAQGVAA